MKPVHVLFLCTANACRSQMAEAMLRHVDPARFDAHSAGAEPAGFVHPLALEVLAALDIPAGEPRSKSWDEFADAELDVVVTLCDYAAGQRCPVWRGSPLTAHWSIPDPVMRVGSPEQRSEFAMAVGRDLLDRVSRLTALRFDGPPTPDLQQQLDLIAQS